MNVLVEIYFYANDATKDVIDDNQFIVRILFRCDEGQREVVLFHKVDTNQDDQLTRAELDAVFLLFDNNSKLCPQTSCPTCIFGSKLAAIVMKGPLRPPNRRTHC